MKRKAVEDEVDDGCTYPQKMQDDNLAEIPAQVSHYERFDNRIIYYTD